MTTGRKYIYFCLILLFCWSCQDRREKVYQVPDDIQPYVSTFLVEAARRGHRLVIDDLIVTYKFDLITSQVHAAGLCRKKHGHTPIIYIDTTSSNWKASQMSKEQLVFHELCHCVLGRGHNIDTLLNGNFASIMKPSGETLYGSILTHFKREYYIDELFNPLTERPAWAQVTEVYDRDFQQRDTLFFEDFEPQVDSLLSSFIDSSSLDSNKYKFWTLGHNSVIRRTVVEGRMELENYQKGSFFIPFYVDIPKDEDFEIQVKMVIPGGRKGQMAFYWGGSTIQNAFAILVSHTGFVSIGNHQEGVAFAKKGIPFINDDFNDLLIRKIGSYYYVFFNKALIDNIQFEPFYGNLFGFGVSGEASEVWIDEVLVTSFR